MAKNRRSSLQKHWSLYILYACKREENFPDTGERKNGGKVLSCTESDASLLSACCWSSIVSEEESPPIRQTSLCRMMRPTRQTVWFETLIRVPGIGITYANRILEARRYATVTHELLKKMRISLKRCACFITCDGKYRGGSMLDSSDLWRLPADGAAQPNELTI